jgi:hypothetical protein
MITMGKEARIELTSLLKLLVENFGDSLIGYYIDGLSPWDGQRAKNSSYYWNRWLEVCRHQLLHIGWNKIHLPI